MNNQATMEKMQTMRLHGMLKAFRSTMETGVKHSFTPDELTGHLIDSEWDERENRKMERLIKAAKFRYQASFEEIDFKPGRNLDKNQMLRLSDCNWIEKRKNIIITGKTGSGKSFLSCALGHQACHYGYKVLYFNCMKFFSMLKECYAEGTYRQQINKIAKVDVLALDDFALEVYEKQSRLNLLEILEDRHGRKSTIIVSQMPIDKWHKIIGDQTIADAICDRLVHTSYKIELKSIKSMRSMREEKAKKA